MKRVYIIGTADTKGPELRYIKTLVEAAGPSALLVDVGTRAPTVPVDVPAAIVAGFHPRGASRVLGTSDSPVEGWAKPSPGSSSRVMTWAA